MDTLDALPFAGPPEPEPEPEKPPRHVYREPGRTWKQERKGHRSPLERQTDLVHQRYVQDWEALTRLLLPAGRPPFAAKLSDEELAAYEAEQPDSYWAGLRQRNDLHPDPRERDRLNGEMFRRWGTIRLAKVMPEPELVPEPLLGGAG